MKKFVCLICGYVHTGDAAPAACPVCGAGPDQFKEMLTARAIPKSACTGKRPLMKKRSTPPSSRSCSAKW